MNRGKLKRDYASLPTLLATALATYMAPCHAPAIGNPNSGPPAPGVSVGAAQFPNDDAVILRSASHFMLDADGTVHRREHQLIKLLNSRPIRRYADRRIDHVDGRDTLIIHAARTHLPDGTIVPVPDYSFNIVGPDEVAGWPEYGDWQQTVVSFSGVEAGAVLELEYEIVTPAGVFPWIDADLPVLSDDPILERVVTFTVPSGVTFHHQFDPVQDGKHGWALSVTDHDGMTQYRWTSRDVPGARREPQSPPGHQQYGRLRFSTCASAEEWVATILDRVDAAAQPDNTIRDFAQAAVEKESDPAERVRKLAGKLSGSFNFLTSHKTMQSMRCRTAAATLHSNYGNPLESATLLLAALQSLGFKASPHVAVDATRWKRSDRVAPTLEAFGAVVVVVDLPDGPMYVHPKKGVFRDPGSWGRRRALRVDAAGSLQETYLYARGEKEPSELRIAGKITVDANGRADGELRIRATGVFFDPMTLETAGAQKTLVADLVGRVLSDFDVSGHSVGMLSNEVFRVTASVASTDALRTTAGRHLLRFGDGPACLAAIPMPLAPSGRRADVRLAGRFREIIDLSIELPEGCALSATPAALEPVNGSWGTVAQTIDVDDKTIRLRRNVEVSTEVMAPGDFEKLRRAVNDLRATRSLLLAFVPTSEQS